MQQFHLDRLIDKYLQGRATPQEESQLLLWYRQQQEMSEVTWESSESEEEVQQRLKKHIWQASVDVDRRSRRRRYVARLSAAASFLVVFSLVGYFYGLRGIQNKQYVFDQPVGGIDSSETHTPINRFVVLEDGSRVILRPGSSLTCLTDLKSAKTRELRLEGEAYFSVSKDKNRPFIVHTGKVKTTVLGTAFSIAARQKGDDVEVSVDHGKVRVERQHMVLAELTAHQQLTVMTQAKANLLPKKVQVTDEQFSWTSSDMHFDGVFFGELTNQLQKRYQLSIDFEHAALMDCPLTGHFEGTETIEEVLKNLCDIRRASFRKDGEEHYVIYGGQPCS